MTDDWGKRGGDDGTGDDWRDGPGDDSTDEEWPDPDEIGTTPDIRRYARLGFAGVVAPLATVFAVVVLAGTYGLPWVVPFFLLVLLPPLSALSLLVALLQSGHEVSIPDWVPGTEWLGARRRGTVGDRLPEHHRDAFSAETRGAASEDRDAVAPLVRAFFLYLFAVPVHAVLVVLVAGA